MRESGHPICATEPHQNDGRLAIYLHKRVIVHSLA